MIRSFRCRDTEALFNDREVPRFRAFERVARRKLLYLHRAKRLDDLRAHRGTA
jgi:proteic killer suppression protein